MGIAILDSGIDGLYNPDLVYPTHTVQNVKVIFNLSDVVTFKGPAPKPLKQGVDIFAENLPNSETSVGHGTHVAGITAALGTASGGYYTGVAPGANVVGVGTGDVLFIFFALAGFDYILEHQQAYNIKAVNNSWGTSGAFDPKDPINKASKTVHNHGVTVVFAAGNDGPDQNTLNPYSVAPWVIGVAAGCKLVSPDPTNSAIHCADQTGQNRAPILADFSSRGLAGDPLYHPDITAPGVHIVSTRASTGTVLNGLDANHDFNLTSTCAISAANEPFYTCASGTSMATPHVVGVVALMQQAAGGPCGAPRARAGRGGSSPRRRLRTIQPPPGAFWCSAGRSRARSRQNRATAPISPIQVSSRRFAVIRRRSVSSLYVTSVGWINRQVMALFSVLARITSVQSRSACSTVPAVRKFRMRSSPRESSSATGK